MCQLCHEGSKSFYKSFEDGCGRKVVFGSEYKVNDSEMRSTGTVESIEVKS